MKDLLNQFFAWLYKISSAYMGREGKSIEALKDELSHTKAIVDNRQALLDKVQADNKLLKEEKRKLEDTIRYNPNILAKLLNKSDEELQEGLAFNVYQSEGSEWEVTTAYCSLGGCDMDVYSFQTQREALLFAAFMTAMGLKPKTGTACPTCYAEYIKDCI